MKFGLIFNSTTKLFYLLLISFTGFTSCDAYVYMSYGIKNKTEEVLKIHIPHYQSNSKYGSSTDTTILLEPNGVFYVATASKIDFPWGKKNIYKNSPGICGIECIKTDTLLQLGCTSKEWKYKHGCAIYYFK